MSELLTLSGVETQIGRYHILHGVELGVAEGQTTMLLGRNGAGKTTTLRTIMGLWRASRGEIRLGEKRIDALATPDIARAGIGYVPETMAVFSDLTVREDLVLARRYAVGRAEADALVCALADRAAPAAADRRADQGTRARDHRRADR